MRRYWKPILLLIVLSPVLAEVISGATPITQIVLPWILLFYIVFLYGLQVLVIREVATRRGFGPLGLWCLGLIYGLYNEGLRAQTLFYPLHAPIDDFSTYGLVANVRVPFTLLILFWHGLFSVVTPILLVEYVFPEKAREPWLSVKATWSLAILSVTTAVAYFLFLGDDRGTQKTTTLVVHFTFIVVAAVVLWFVAARLPRTPRVTSDAGGDGVRGDGTGWKPFLSGAALFVFSAIVPEILAGTTVPWPLFVLYFAALAVVGTWTMGRHRETSRRKAVVFVLGAGTAQAVLSLVFGALTGNVMWAISGVVFATIFVTTLVRLRRKGTVAAAPTPRSPRA
jgi:hypothetical protein